MTIVGLCVRDVSPVPWELTVQEGRGATRFVNLSCRSSASAVQLGN